MCNPGRQRKVFCATILPEVQHEDDVKLSEKRLCEREVSRAGNWLKSPFWITVVSHQTSRKICTGDLGRVGDMPCHSHQYSSAFLTSPSSLASRRVEFAQLMLHRHHLHRCLSCEILRDPSQVVPALAATRQTQQNGFSGANFSQPFSGLTGFVHSPPSVSFSASSNSHLLANTHLHLHTTTLTD